METNDSIVSKFLRMASVPVDTTKRSSSCRDYDPSSLSAKAEEVQYDMERVQHRPAF